MCQCSFWVSSRVRNILYPSYNAVYVTTPIFIFNDIIHHIYIWMKCIKMECMIVNVCRRNIFYGIFMRWCIHFISSSSIHSFFSLSLALGLPILSFSFHIRFDRWHGWIFLLALSWFERRKIHFRKYASDILLRIVYYKR